jgi:hypothetical protein
MQIRNDGARGYLLMSGPHESWSIAMEQGVTEQAGSLRIDLKPSQDAPRTLELQVNLHPYGATMDATAFVSGSVILTTRFHKVRDWRLRPGMFAALIIGPMSLALTETEGEVLRAALEPLGIEVLALPARSFGTRDVDGT